MSLTKDNVDRKLFDLLAEIDAIADASEFPALLTKLLDLYGLKSVAYLGSPVSTPEFVIAASIRSRVSSSSTS